MAKTKKSQLRKRIESFAWRAGGFAVVAGFTYIMQIGSIWNVDFKVLIDITVMAAIALVVNEITKYVNE